VLGVDIDPAESAADLAAFANRIGARYGHVHDTDGTLSQALTVKALDTTVILDTAGRIVYRDATATDEATLRAAGAGQGGRVVTAIALAFGAGVLATVNPCGIVMLPAFMAYCLGHNDSGDPASDQAGGRFQVARLTRGFGVGLAVSTGFVVVLVAVGLLIVAGLRQLVQAAPWAAVVVGVILMIVGDHVGHRGGRSPCQASTGCPIATPVRPRGADGQTWWSTAQATRSFPCPARSGFCCQWWRRPPQLPGRRS